MFDLVEVAGFEQGGVHHPPDLPGQPQHQLQAAGGEAEAGQDQDGTEDDQETQQLVLKPENKIILHLDIIITTVYLLLEPLYTLL